MPCSTTLSKKSLESWGTPDFADNFLTEMMENESDLPLDIMCTDGSTPSNDDSAECTDLSLDEPSEGVVTGRFHVSFNEETGTGCRDNPRTDPVSGHIDFEMVLATGEIKFEKPVADAREPDPDEI